MHTSHGRVDLDAAFGDGHATCSSPAPPACLAPMLVRRWTTSGMSRRIAVLVRDRRAVGRDRAPARAAARCASSPSTATSAREGLGLDARCARAARARRDRDRALRRRHDVLAPARSGARSSTATARAHVLELAADCPHVARVAYVSTAFVAGRRTGVDRRSPPSAATEQVGWVNAYEQSKAEAGSARARPRAGTGSSCARAPSSATT